MKKEKSTKPIKPEIRRGAIVEITDWPENWNKGGNKPWLVTQRFKDSNNKPIARIETYKPAIGTIKEQFQWTVADLKRIGFHNLPALNKPVVLIEQTWYVHAELIIEHDGKDVYYVWNAYTQDYDPNHFVKRIEFNQSYSELNKTRTIKSCLNNWKRFAEINGLKKYQIMFSKENDAGEISFWSKIKNCSDIFHTQWCAIYNDWSTLYNYLYFNQNMYGMEVEPKEGKTKRLLKMKNNGDWDKFKFAEMLITKKQSLVKYYDNFSQMHMTSGTYKGNNEYWKKYIEDLRKQAKITWTMNKENKENKNGKETNRTTRP